MRDLASLKSYLMSEEAHVFEGWDFSYIKDRCIETSPAWDYKAKIKEFLKPESRVLDMGTGDGRFLLSLEHKLELLSATEGYKPNYELCLRTLAPMGVNVQWVGSDRGLSFPDESFDIVINRHEEYDLNEVKRVLKKGGYFITQQVGGMNSIELSRRLIKAYTPPMPSFNLENEAPAFKAAGLRVMYKNQSYTEERFLDTGAIVFYAKQIPWSFPSFSVEESFEALSELDEQINEQGFFSTKCHRFIIIAKK